MHVNDMHVRIWSTAVHLHFSNLTHVQYKFWNQKSLLTLWNRFTLLPRINGRQHAAAAFNPALLGMHTHTISIWCSPAVWQQQRQSTVPYPGQLNISWSNISSSSIKWSDWRHLFKRQPTVKACRWSHGSVIYAKYFWSWLSVAIATGPVPSSIARGPETILKVYLQPIFTLSCCRDFFFWDNLLQ